MFSGKTEMYGEVHSPKNEPDPDLRQLFYRACLSPFQSNQLEQRARTFGHRV